MCGCGFLSRQAYRLAYAYQREPALWSVLDQMFA